MNKNRKRNKGVKQDGRQRNKNFAIKVTDDERKFLQDAVWDSGESQVDFILTVVRKYVNGKEK